jgi:hypothetical protein
MQNGAPTAMADNSDYRSLAADGLTALSLTNQPGLEVIHAKRL